MPRPCWGPTFLLLSHGLCVCATEANASKESAKASSPAMAVLTFRGPGPGHLEGSHPAYFAAFSGQSLPDESVALVAPSDEVGCFPYPQKLGKVMAFVAVVRRGNCTFVWKAQVAQRSGAVGVLVVSDDEVVQPMATWNKKAAADVNIFVLGVGRQLGRRMRNASLMAAEEGRAPPTMSLSFYSPVLDLNEGLLIFLATLLVVLGAEFSAADLEVLPTAQASPQHEVMEPDYWMVFGFLAAGSALIVGLFFFVRYLTYFLMLAFCLGGASCIARLGAGLLARRCPPLRSQACSLPCAGALAYADVLASLPAAALVISWVAMRNTASSWVLQDILGAGFLCSLQRTFRLPNIKMSTLLLTTMFFFEVFILPTLSHDGVTISAATNAAEEESMPMMLRLPAFSNPLGRDRLLGFGDIALPGLLVSYLRRHDVLSQRSLLEGYYAPAVVGYFLGLCATVLVLLSLQIGKPALVYLVPGTLGTTLILATVRGEMRLLWEGRPARFPKDILQIQGGSTII